MKIFDLKLKRSFLGAIGFYVFYFFISVLTIAMLISILGSFNDSYNLKGFEHNFNVALLFGLNMGVRLAVLISIIFPLTILSVKKIYNASFLLCLLGGALASFGGLLLGLIPSAIISTFYSRDEKLQIIENKKTIEIDNGIEEESVDIYKNLTESMSEQEIRKNRAIGITTLLFLSLLALLLIFISLAEYELFY